MAELLQEQLDLNTAIAEAQDGSIEQSIIATPYFEDYLYKIFTDINAINDEISAAAVTDGANVGGFAEVFQEKDGTILEFRTLQSSDASVGITQNADDLDLSVALNTADGTVANSLLTWDGVDTWTELAELLLSWSTGVATLLVEDSLGANQIGLTIDGDGQTGFFWDGVEVANTRAAAAGGMFIDNQLTGAGFERVLTTSDAGGGTTVNPGTALNTILTWDNISAWTELSELTLGWAAGVLTVSVEDDLAALQSVWTADADAGQEWFYDGAAAAELFSNGIGCIDSLGGTNPSLGLLNSAGTLLGNFTMSAGAQFIDNRVNGGTVTFRASNVGVTDEVYLDYATNGALTSYYSDDEAFASDSLGMVVYGVGADADPRINFLDGPAGAQVGNIRATTTGFVVDNRIVSGLIKLRGNHTTLGVRDCVLGDVEGATELYFNGQSVPSIRTANYGGDVQSDGTASANPALAYFNNSVRTGFTQIGTTAGQWRINSEVHGAEFTLSGEDAGGTLRLMMAADPDNITRIYGAGTLNITAGAATLGFYGVTPAAQSAAYTRNATIVESRTLLASASATTLNNNNVLAALIADLQAIGILA